MFKFERCFVYKLAWTKLITQRAKYKAVLICNIVIGETPAYLIDDIILGKQKSKCQMNLPLPKTD